MIIKTVKNEDDRLFELYKKTGNQVYLNLHQSGFAFIAKPLAAEIAETLFYNHIHFVCNEPIPGADLSGYEPWKKYDKE